MRNFEVKEKATVTVTLSKMPGVLKVMRGSLLYFFRELTGRMKDADGVIKINILHPGSYTLSHEAESIKVEPIRIHPLPFPLPPKDRDLFKSFEVVYNPDLKNTPARNFTGHGIIEVSPQFKKLPHFIQEFIMLHEVGHFYYKDEINADLYALKKYIEKGYNNSGAYYSLTKVLRPTEANKKRIDNLYKHLEFNRR